MKSAPCKRRTCEIVKDLLVGLAVFFTVFMLATLDSREVRSAPAVISKPAVMARSAIVSNHTGAIHPASLQLRPGSGYALAQVTGADNETARSPIGGTGKPGVPGTLNDYTPDSAYEKPDSSINPAPHTSRLALKKTKRGTDVFRVAGVSTTMSRSWMIAVMALFFAAMTAITLSLWRQLRSSVTPKRGRKV